MAFLPTELNASGSAFRSIVIADKCPSSQIVQQSDDLHWNLPPNKYLKVIPMA